MAKKPEPPPLSSWSIYKVADYGIGTRWLGTVEAPDKTPLSERPLGNSRSMPGACTR